jgi:hypothetical protein
MQEGTSPGCNAGLRLLARMRDCRSPRDMRDGAYDFSGPGFEPVYDYAGNQGRGIYFVPGRGLANEGCGLPTSTCPNYARPVD